MQPHDDDDDAPFVTIQPAVAHEKYCVVVMAPSMGGHVSTRTSPAISKMEAEALATTWAARMGLKRR